MPSRPPLHRPPKAKLSDPRPNSAAKGYGSQWRKLRRIVLNEQPLCQRCHHEGATVVDHIVAKEKGGTDERSNLQSLCHACHNSKGLECDGLLGRKPKESHG